MGRRGRKTQRQAFFGEDNSNHQPPSHVFITYSAELAIETNPMTLERRNWSSLPELVVAIISNFLLSEDVTEYIRFRAVCPGWRQSTAPPSNIESLFRPQNWIMIISGKREKCWSTFFNISSGRCLLVDIPQFREGYTPISSADGLLVLLRRRKTGELCLLHPFTLSITQLPNVDSLHSMMIYYEPSIVNFLSSSIVVCFFRSSSVAFARIRGNRWFGTDFEVNCSSTLSFQGQLYAVHNNTGELLQFELEEATIGPSLDPKLNVTTRIPTFGYASYHGLLEYGGKMLLLRKCRDLPPFEVYEIDVLNRRLIPTTIPPDRTIFAAENRCLSLSTSVSPSILPQSIYYNHMFWSDIEVYGSHRPNLAPTNSYYPHPEIYHRTQYSVNYIGPFSLSDYLISHCSNFLRYSRTM
ncbi:hypothetical protein FCM35_KLT19316 [Carex littledalei]|uniref:KIB1-4 beta-propeller domain-containing protein n=1 Tax=Carex littledalei TaxID=544730 RepID=A0A833R1D3_9POAL|nr:hypothetical protein FCM35_KLT19316 [Carex littledalei]